MDCITSVKLYKETVIKLLRDSGRPLTFAEIFKGVKEICGSVSPNRFLLRKAIAELVRNGVIMRRSSYEISRHVFELRR